MSQQILHRTRASAHAACLRLRQGCKLQAPAVVPEHKTLGVAEVWSVVGTLWQAVRVYASGVHAACLQAAQPFADQHGAHRKAVLRHVGRRREQRGIGQALEQRDVAQEAQPPRRRGVPPAELCAAPSGAGVSSKSTSTVGDGGGKLTLLLDQRSMSEWDYTAASSRLGKRMLCGPIIEASFSMPNVLLYAASR